MDNAYQDPKNAQKYLNFLNSENGRIQKELLSQAVYASLPKNPETKILDAGCGPGWLAGSLAKHFIKIYACDASTALLDYAKTNYKGINFELAKLEGILPYQPNFFDVVILNMVAPDLENQTVVFKNLNLILKPSGKLIMTIPNPYYTYPVAEWKRTWLEFLLNKKPRLIIKPYFKAGQIQREFGMGEKILSNFYSFSDYLENAKQAGFSLVSIVEIQPKKDSQKFDLNYQLKRFPLVLLLDFVKIIN